MAKCWITCEGEDSYTIHFAEPDFSEEDEAWFSQDEMSQVTFTQVQAVANLTADDLDDIEIDDDCMEVEYTVNSKILVTYTGEEDDGEEEEQASGN
jgi:hypothetical protein